MLRKVLIITLIGLRISYAVAQTAISNSALESIAALKKGKSFGTKNYLSSDGKIIWKADPVYKNGIAGIGRDSNLGFLQFSAYSKNEDAILRITFNNDIPNLEDQQFLIWAHNNAPLTLTSGEVPSKSIQERLKREWKVQNNGILSINISISLPELNYSGKGLDEFELLITGSNGDFSSDSVKRIKADSLSFGILYFKNIRFDQEQVFTLVTDIQHKPKLLMPKNYTAEAERYYRKTFRVYDKDRDRVVLTLEHLPEWLNFINNQNGTYTIKGLPRCSYKAQSKIQFSLDDGIEKANYLIEIPIVSSLAKKSAKEIEVSR